MRNQRQSLIKDNVDLPRCSLFIFIAASIIIFALIIISGTIITTNGRRNPGAGDGVFLNDESKFKVKEHLISSGEVFSNLAVGLGLTDKEVQEIIQASERVYDLAQIRAGNRIESSFDLQTNEFKKMIYNIDEDNYLVIEKTENGISAQKIKNKYDIELTRDSGIVKDSLYLTGQNLGLKDKTIMEMADIFAWDIDFGLEVREGDEFELLYEKRSLNGEEVSPGRILAARYQNQDKNHWAIYYKDPEGREDYYDLEGNCLRRQFLKAPINYRYISSSYSLKRLHPVWNIYTTHRAIDYVAACGTPVSAAGDGTVIFVGWKNNVYGKTVEIRHNGVYTTRYSHLSAYGKDIKYGVRVTQGQIVGFVGITGTSTGCHLDYAMTKYSQLINPLTQNFERSEPIKDLYREDFEFHQQTLLEFLSQQEAE